MTVGEWCALAGVMITVVGIGGGIVVWAVRLEGRCNLLDANHEALADRQKRDEDALKDVRTSIEAQITAGFQQVRQDLSRIFDKLDEKADKPR